MPQLGFHAVVFDLDGVITKTALVHSQAWKNMFDEFLRKRAEKSGEPFKEFTHGNDYLNYVDGKPRYEGVKSFLESRGIELPMGDPNDSPEKETICGIGNRKNLVFNETLKESGVEVFESTIALIKEMKRRDIRIGVASSSKNCLPVLQAAGIENLFETRVDGVESAKLGLKGKPEPDIFTTAADNLGVSNNKTAIVEDAVSGVAAGKKGNFGLVLGLARENNKNELRAAGADIVVSDLEEFGLDEFKAWFNHKVYQDNWTIRYYDFDPGKEKSREALLTIGNGYFGTRGAMEEMEAGPVHYPGTYMSGIYNRLTSKVGDREVENEDFVNTINWLPVKFRIGDDDWIDITKEKIIEIKRVMHFNDGHLYRRIVIEDGKGRHTRIESRRFASMDNMHLAALEYTITPLNYSDRITVRSGLYGDHTNAGVDRYKDLNQKHLKPVNQFSEGALQCLEVETTQSGIRIAAAANFTVTVNQKRVDVPLKEIHAPGRTEFEFSYDSPEEHALTVTKVVALFHSLDHHVEEPITAARETAMKRTTFDEMLNASAKRWDSIWDRIDIKLEGDRFSQRLLRMHLYHLMVTCSPHNAYIDFGIPARGLHGEAYRGHIFWDELFILPLYHSHFPETARSVLMYRYRRLSEARLYAQSKGYDGAMFPWQSGSSGREETQVVHLNPVSGEWGDDYSSLQRHISLAIAYNIWQYYQITGDQDFIEDYGAEMFLEICKFWISKCKQDASTGRYSIDKVMGPDEFHEKYPGAPEGGLKDNAYTNIMVAWMLDKAKALLQTMEGGTYGLLLKNCELSEKDIEKWQEVATKLNVVISDEGIIAQYDGYFDLAELDWDAYREKYGNIYRMDRILKAEGKSPDDYKVSKQADTLMTFYNLDKDKVDLLLDRMGYDLPGDYVDKNLKYYLERTSHGSTLSRVVHARLAHMAGDRALSWDLFSDALASDYQDVQGGTTGEGIHAGVMAGTAWIALTVYGGLNLNKEIPSFDPDIPDAWDSISFGFTFRGCDYECEVDKEKLRIRIESDNEREDIILQGMHLSVMTNRWNEFSLR
jgi:beta-phosphoglucomutase family hydrolase